jgi:hypothetical protein
MWAYKIITITGSASNGNDYLILWEYFTITATTSVQQIEERTGFNFESIG